MSFNIVSIDPFLEVHVKGDLSTWDLLRVIHHVQKHDPEKNTPDLWVLDPDLDFSIHSFPMIVQGVLKLAARISGKASKSALLAADEFQRIKLDMYCAEAGDLPYEVRSFTSREKAIDWLLN